MRGIQVGSRLERIARGPSGAAALGKEAMVRGRQPLEKKQGSGGGSRAPGIEHISYLADISMLHDYKVTYPVEVPFCCSERVQG